MTTILDDTLVSDLAEQVSGSVLGQQNAGYDAARAVQNGLIGPRPGRGRCPRGRRSELDRLADVKRRYDLHNVFHLNHNIAIREG
ncbi:MAG TPA: BBE domain-containing protein [Gaiellaceae bacterium]|nr:BBE domain-containing protein [Gaiellaceae bacterium]